jgi:hypothetical protein
MVLCRACEGKCICHTESAFEEQAETKTEPHLQTVLWQPQSNFLHIKRETENSTQATTDFFDLLLNKKRGHSKEQQNFFSYCLPVLIVAV